MHKEHDSEACLNEGKAQKLHDMLAYSAGAVSDEDLQRRNRQDDEVNDDIALEALFAHGAAHKFPPRLFLNVQQVNKRNDEHPYQVNEVPIKPPEFHVLRFVSASFVSERNDRKRDHPSKDVGKMQAGNG